MIRHAALSRARPLSWHPLLCLTLALFLLRAVVPAGYMPDPGALRHGELALALCVPSGTVYDLSKVMPTDPAQPAAPDHQACPFGMLGTPLASSDTSPVLRLPLTAIPPLPPAARHLPFSADGPPVGTRAPPDTLPA